MADEEDFLYGDEPEQDVQQDVEGEQQQQQEEEEQPQQEGDVPQTEDQQQQQQGDQVDDVKEEVIDHNNEGGEEVVNEDNDDDDDDDEDSDDDVQITIDQEKIKTVQKFGGLSGVVPGAPFKGPLEKKQGKFNVEEFDKVGQINGQEAHEFDLEAVEDKPWRRPGKLKIILT